MSKFFSKKYNNLIPYIPGEQPKDRKFIKLNTNESPFPPSPFAQRLARECVGNLQLYSDPECRDLIEVASKKFNLKKENILFSNGSDEILNFAFMAFCDSDNPAVFPDITYGFYPVFAELNNIPYKEIPLQKDYTININDYIGVNKTIFIANPNAPTGIALSKNEIEKIIKGNPNNVVVIDEAYVDFGGESVIDLVKEYDNLLVIQTFSKSRSMAGARLGMGFANEKIIKDLTTIKYSINPYNVNSMTQACGIGALIDDEYFNFNCKEIIKNREYVTKELTSLEFEVLPSKANFIFAKCNKFDGEKLYTLLREKGILVRYFSKPRLKDFCRISIGNIEEMQSLIKAVKEILCEQ